MATRPLISPARLLGYVRTATRRCSLHTPRHAQTDAGEVEQEEEEEGAQSHAALPMAGAMRKAVRSVSNSDVAALKASRFDA